MSALLPEGTRIKFKNIALLYSKYANDLKRIIKQQEIFYQKYNLKWYQKNILFNTLLYRGHIWQAHAKSSIGEEIKVYPPCFGDLEAEITYLLIRESKPKSIVEFSPASGWSTSWILSALRDNGSGFLTSIDLRNDSEKMLPKELTQLRWKLILEDVHKVNFDLFKNCDYLFIDSDHSKDFAEWYISAIFPLIKRDTPVSVHDIFLRKEVYGEISILLNWLKSNNISYCSPSKYVSGQFSILSDIMKSRREIGLTKFIHKYRDSAVFFFI